MKTNGTPAPAVEGLRHHRPDVGDVIAQWFESTSRPALIALESTGEILAANGSAAALVGQSANQLVGQLSSAVGVTGDWLTSEPLRVDGVTYVVRSFEASNIVPILEQRLQESERQSRLLVEETADYGIFMLDLQGRVLSWNPGAQRIKGYPAGEIVGQHFSVFFTEEDRAQGHPDRALAQAAARGRFAEEGWRLRKGGERFWAADVLTALHGTDGALIGYGKVTRDLTERRRAEEAVAESASRLTSLVEGSQDAFILCESEVPRRVLYANAAVETIFGIKPIDLLERPPGAGALAVGGEIDQWLNARDPADREHEFTIDGARQVRVRAVGLPNAVPPQAALFIEDVTERRRTESELLESRERFNQIVQSLTDAFVIIDVATSKVYYASPSFREVFGFSTEELLAGRRVLSLVHPDEADALVATWQSSVHGARSAEFRIAHSRLGTRWIRARFSPLAGIETGSNLVSIVCEDITERKRTEEALLAAQREAVEASEAKNEFLSRMSHELRTPMNAVLGFAQLLQQDELTESQAESVAQILKSGDHLLNLINEVLDIARIESGYLDVDPVAVNLESLIPEVVDLVRPLAIDASVSLSVLPAEVVWVLADVQRLRQVLINLVTNGIKYNRIGGTVTVHARPSGEQVEIDVTDTGVGIADSDLPRLFRPFDRLGQVKSTVEGSGVGLALSRHLVEAMDGSLTVRSIAGAGSTFTVRLPRAPIVPAIVHVVDSAPGLAEPPLHVDIRRLVYIEDNASNLRLVERILEARPGWVMTGACTGVQGLRMARETKPHLVMLDLHLPDMSGVDVLQALRADPSTADLPVVILTADATAAQVSRLRSEGVLDYLTKPLSVPALLALLDASTGDAP